MIHALAFYLFAGLAILSGAMVISARNPVHSVLWLILAFLNAAGLFVLMGAEFLAMLLVIVYVGAVAVLFLFVVMMLDIDFTELRRGFQEYLPFGLALGVVLLIELALVLLGWQLGPDAAALRGNPTPVDVQNTQALGQLIYTHYAFLFEAAGLVLLVAMIGAIVLTHRIRPGVKRQNVGAQVARRPHDAIDVITVKPGQGI